MSKQILWYRVRYLEPKGGWDKMTVLTATSVHDARAKFLRCYRLTRKGELPKVRSVDVIGRANRG